MVVALEGA
jgi:hypothetical protein